jgi:hypothetical protein
MMRICAIYALALLTVPLKTSAQPDSPAANAATQRNLQAARVERLRKAMSDAKTLEFLAAQLYVENRQVQAGHGFCDRH